MTPSPATTQPVGYLRGHEAVWDGDCWRWRDNGVACADEPRKCGGCGLAPTESGADACLGEIKGATGACCGHTKHPGYVSWPGIGVESKNWWRGAYLLRPVED